MHSFAYHPATAAFPAAGRLALETRSDGTVTRHTYAANPTVPGGYIHTRESGPGDANGVSAGTRVITRHDALGNVTETTRQDIASGVVLSTETVVLADASGRPLKTVYDNDPGDYEENTYACCGLASSRARDGTVTHYIYDYLKRQIRTTTTTGARVTTRTTTRGFAQNRRLESSETTATGVEGSIVQSTVRIMTSIKIALTPGP